MKNTIALCIVGFSLFSMFFGGGNLVFPLLVGIESSSPLLSVIGFILSSVFLPFYGVLIGILFEGDYQKALQVWGKPFAHLMIFLLLFFWIPLGSGPRCNQLAYGAFCELTQGVPLWLYSLFYSVLVFVLSLQRGRFLSILGKVVTPLLVFFLCLLIFSLFNQTIDFSLTGDMAFQNFTSALVKGYNTMDFIAAIFFSSAIISLLKENQKEKFKYSFVRNACLIAVSLLTVIYIGMFTIGCLKSGALESVSGARLLITVGNLMFGEKLKIIVFMIITLSVFSTSMALSLVFSDYLKKTLFKEKLGYRTCLFISVSISFIMSTVGFENLSLFISYIMTILYPVLLIMTTLACGRKLLQKRPSTSGLEMNEIG